jgi:hypothetical protein
MRPWTAPGGAARSPSGKRGLSSSGVTGGARQATCPACGIVQPERALCLVCGAILSRSIDDQGQKRWGASSKRITSNVNGPRMVSTQMHSPSAMLLARLAGRDGQRRPSTSQEKLSRVRQNSRNSSSGSGRNRSVTRRSRDDQQNSIRPSTTSTSRSRRFIRVPGSPEIAWSNTSRKFSHKRLKKGRPRSTLKSPSNGEDGSWSHEQPMNMPFGDHNNTLGGGSFLHESSTLMSPVSNNQVDAEFAKYSEWNFAPSSESGVDDEAHRKLAVAQHDEAEFDELTLLQEQLSSEVGYNVSISWLCGVPPEFVHEALNFHSTRKNIDLSAWPVRDSFMVELAKRSQSWLVTLDLSGSVHLTDRGVSSILASTSSTLQFLNIAGCWRVTERGFEVPGKHAPGGGKPSPVSSLVKLDVSNLPHLDDLFVRTIAKSAYTRYLRRLYMRDCPLLSDAGFGALKSMPRLEAVAVDNCRGLHGRTFREVLDGCLTLRELVASRVILLSDDAIRSIAARKASFGYTGGVGGGSLELRIVNFAHCRRLTDGSLQWLMGKLYRVREIDLSGCTLISDATLSMVARSCPGLTTLKLKGCARITDTAVVFLAKSLAEHNRFRTDVGGESSSQSSLSEPVLHGAGVYDYLDQNNDDDGGDGGGGGHPHRSSSYTLSTPKPIGLTELDFSGCARIGDVGMRAITRVSGHLRTLRLNDMPSITDVTVGAIARSCTQLEHVEIARNIRIGDASVRSLVKRVRRCTLEGRSIAIGKRAFQSTTLAGRGAQFAVDSNKTGYYGKSYDDEEGRVSHTCQQPNPWWIVDLGVIVDIGYVRVWGAADSNRYAQNFPLWIMCSELPFNELVEEKKPTNQGGLIHQDEPCIHPGAVDCESIHGVKIRVEESARVLTHRFDRPARYIRVQSEGNGPLILGEVDVFYRGTLTLNLGGCTQLTGASASTIARYFVHLLHLDLSHCAQVEGESLKEVFEECVRLCTLDLTGCVGLTDESLAAFSGRKCRLRPELTSISLTSCSRLSDRGIVSVLAVCPNLAKCRLDRIPRLTSSVIKVLGRVCKLVELMMISPTSLVHRADVQKHVSGDGFQLATYFDTGKVIGCEPRSDSQVLRLCNANLEK